MCAKFGDLITIFSSLLETLMFYVAGSGGSMSLIFLLLCFGTVQSFNFCVHKGETHPLNVVFADKCNRCLCREWGVDTAVCTNIKCNKLVLNAPGCTHNCLASKQDLKLKSSLKKLLKSKKSKKIADSALRVIGDQAFQFVLKSSTHDERQIDSKQHDEVPQNSDVTQNSDVMQNDELPKIGDVRQNDDITTNDDVIENEEVTRNDKISTRNEENVEESLISSSRGEEHGRRRGKKELKKQLDILMLGKKKRRSKFSID